MPFSVRLDERTEAIIDSLARSSGKSRSAVVREAVAHYAAAGTRTTGYEKLEPLIGLIHSGRGDRSQQTGRKFANLLKSRRVARARRSR